MQKSSKEKLQKTGEKEDKGREKKPFKKPILEKQDSLGRVTKLGGGGVAGTSTVS